MKLMCGEIRVNPALITFYRAKEALGKMANWVNQALRATYFVGATIAGAGVLGGCKKDPIDHVIPIQTKLNGVGTANSISMMNDIVDNPVQGISVIITDETGKQYKAYMMKASTKANATVHFQNSNLINENTFDNGTFSTGICAQGLNTPNAVQIDFYAGKEQMGLSKIVAGITPTTEFVVAVPNDQKRLQLKNNMNSNFKKMVDEAVLSTWSEDINGAQPENQQQRVAVELTLLP